MNWRDVLHTAMDAVRSHRLRSALTMLGILIGITAVVLTVGIGAGARADVQDDINALGTNVLVISPGSSTSSTGVRGGFGSASTLTEQDAEALTSSDAAPDVEAVAPVYHVFGIPGERVHELDHDPHGNDTRRGRRCARVTSATAASSATPTWTTPRPSWCSGATPRAELFAGPGPGRAVGQLQRRDARGRRRARTAELVRGDDEQRPGHRSALDVRATTGRWDQPQHGELDLREGDDASTLSAAYQESQALLLNNHGIANAADADFSIATAQSVLSTATVGRRHAHGDARRHRGHRAARRWHRCDEHHVGLGHRAHPRDRVAQGDRCSDPR